LEHFIIQMAVNMKENGKIIINTVRESSLLKMALNILAHSIKIGWLREKFHLKTFSKQHLKILPTKKTMEKVKMTKVKLTQKLVNLKLRVNQQIQ